MKIFSEKLNAIAEINRNINKDYTTLVLFTNDIESLTGLNTSISNMLDNIWKQPEIVVSIINSTNLDDLKNYISPFFVHNFYDNIFSKDSIDSNLIYILTLLLTKEIDNIDDFTSNDNNFLEKSRCSILLEEFRRKHDVQNYFKNIIEKTIESLEDKYNLIEYGKAFKFSVKFLMISSIKFITIIKLN